MPLTDGGACTEAADEAVSSQVQAQRRALPTHHYPHWGKGDAAMGPGQPSCSCSVPPRTQLFTFWWTEQLRGANTCDSNPFTPLPG